MPFGKRARDATPSGENVIRQSENLSTDQGPTGENALGFANDTKYTAVAIARATDIAQIAFLVVLPMTLKLGCVYICSGGTLGTQRNCENFSAGHTWAMKRLLPVIPHLMSFIDKRRPLRRHRLGCGPSDCLDQCTQERGKKYFQLLEADSIRTWG